MHLFVIRHAIAEDVAPNGDDSRRELTRDGERKFKQAVRGLRELGWHFDRVLTSPWRRALRTAELLAPIRAQDPIVTPLLASAPGAELLAAIGDSEPSANKLAVVGHQPWLGELVSLLAYGDSSHGAQLVFKKGGAVWLEGSAVAGGMSVRAVLPPSLLRKLG